jgi:hypothetical protein
MATAQPGLQHSARQGIEPLGYSSWLQQLIAMDSNVGTAMLIALDAALSAAWCEVQQLYACWQMVGTMSCLYKRSASA